MHKYIIVFLFVFFLNLEFHSAHRSQHIALSILVSWFMFWVLGCCVFLLHSIFVCGFVHLFGHRVSTSFLDALLEFWTMETKK